MGELPPEKRSPLRHAVMVEGIGASLRIEGSTITDAEVEHVLRALSINPNWVFSIPAEQEAAGYVRLMEKVFSDWRDIPLTESSIREMHRELLSDREEAAGQGGRYKAPFSYREASPSGDVKAGTGVADVISLVVPRQMSELIAWLKEEQTARRLHSLLIIALWVAGFLQIHPFHEGNGPLSRVLTTLLLLQSGYSYVQYSSLESVIEQNKEAYELALRQTQESMEAKSPNWQPWLVFFLRSLAQQVTRLEQKIERKTQPRD
jgi:Fic family protein